MPGLSVEEKRLALWRPHGSTLCSPLGPGGLGFPAAPPVPHCPARDRTRGINRELSRGSMAPEGRQETEAPKQEGCVGDTLEAPRPQAQCSGTQSLSWEDP